MPCRKSMVVPLLPGSSPLVTRHSDIVTMPHLIQPSDSAAHYTCTTLVGLSWLTATRILCAISSSYGCGDLVSAGIPSQPEGVNRKAATGRTDCLPTGGRWPHGWVTNRRLDRLAHHANVCASGPATNPGRAPESPPRTCQRPNQPAHRCAVVEHGPGVRTRAIGGSHIHLVNRSCLWHDFEGDM